MGLRVSILARLTAILAGVALGGSLQASPQVVRISGTLFDVAGAPLTGNRDLRISAYSVNTGGSSLWTSAVMQAVATDGQFSVALDASTGSPTLVSRISALASTDALWFEVEVDDGTAGNAAMDTARTMKPRIRSKGTLYAVSTASTDALRGVTLGTAAPTDTQVLAYNSANNRWEPQNPSGKDATHPTEAARRTSAAMTVYVRTDGSDSTCNGSANASSASAPACAYATPQKAVDAIPEIVLHGVTVTIGAGAYRAATASATLLTVQKMVTGAGSILLDGSAGVTFSGAASGAPTTAVGDYGIDIYAPSTQRITVKNITTQYFVQSGVRLNPNSGLLLDGVTVTNNTASGVQMTNAYAELQGANVFNTNGIGLDSSHGQVKLLAGSLTANSNTNIGLQIGKGSVFSAEDSTTITASSNTNYGIVVRDLSFFAPDVVIASSNTNNVGLWVTTGSYYSPSDTLTANSNGTYGLAVGNSSSFYTNSSVTVTSNPTANLYIYSGSQASISLGTLTTSGACSAASVYVLDMSVIDFWSASAAIARGANGAGTGILLDGSAQVVISTTGSFAISQFQTYGIEIKNGSRFIETGGGTKSISNATTDVNVTEMSLYRRGALSAGTCDGSSRCN